MEMRFNYPDAVLERVQNETAQRQMPPLCLMMVLAAMQGTTVYGLLTPYDIGKRLEIGAYSAGIILGVAYSHGFVGRHTVGDKKFYGLLPAGFNWLQLWVQDMLDSIKAANENDIPEARVLQIAPLVADVINYYILTPEANAQHNSWTALPANADLRECFAHGISLIEGAPAARYDNLVRRFCYFRHWRKNELFLEGDSWLQLSANWWPLWSAALPQTTVQRNHG